MSEFQLKSQKVRLTVQDMNSLARQMRGLEDQIWRVQSGLSFEVAEKERIRQRLRQAGNDTEAQYRGLCNSASTLNNIVNTYEATEGRLAGVAVNSAVVRGNEAAWSGKNADFPMSDMIYKSIISALGPIGTVTDAVRRGFEGKTGNVISDIIKLAGGFVKNTDKSGIKWGDWFGINPSTKGPWQGALGKYTDFSSVQKGFSTVCNWASAIVTSGFSNYEEFGNFGARFWEETAAETLLKVGEGILVGGGVAAAFAAAGISAPVLAVGAAAAAVTVAVDWGLDAIVSWATNGAQTSWMEAASDFICDTGEKVVDWAKDTAQKAVNWAKDTGKKIGNAVQNIAGSICNWGVFSFG